MRISDKGLEIIAHYEGLHDGDLSQIGLQPKMCPAGIWTVGYGRAIRVNGRFMRGAANKALAYSMYPKLTEEEARKMLKEDTDNFALAIEQLCREHNLKPKQHQFDAMVSIAYNCGVGCLYNYEEKREMSLLKAIKRGSPTEITRAFGLWNKSGGRVLAGLTRRRASEAHLYNTNQLIF